MGVRRLFKLIANEEVQQLWEEVPVLDLPLLVVDGSSFLFLFCSRCAALSPRCGGDYSFLAQILDDFLGCLAEAGVQLFFVFDGVDIAEKDETCKARATKTFESMDGLLKGQRAEGSAVKPLFAGTVLRQCLRKRGVQYVVADFEADGPVAWKAAWENGFAVSNDSVMLFFDCPGFLPAESFVAWFQDDSSDVPAFWILRPSVLHDHLRLTDSRQVALFAAMCGNDFVDYELMKPWHRQLLERSDQRYFHMDRASAELRCVADWVHEKAICGYDTIAAAFECTAPELHDGIKYSVDSAYSLNEEELSTVCSAHFALSTPALVKRYRRGLMDLTVLRCVQTPERALSVPALPDRATGLNSWAMSDLLRGAVVLLGGRRSWTEQRRKDQSKELVSLKLVYKEAQLLTDLAPGGVAWLDPDSTGTADSRAAFFRSALYWPDMETDAASLQEHLLLPIAALRYLVLQDDSPVLKIAWPTAAAFFMLWVLPRQRRLEVIASLRAAGTREAFAPEAVEPVAAYLATLWSVGKLHFALGFPTQARTDIPASFDGPFLHAIHWWLGEGGRESACVVGSRTPPSAVTLDKKKRPVLHAAELLVTRELESFDLLVNVLLNSIRSDFPGDELPFQGKANLSKRTFTWPRPWEIKLDGPRNGAESKSKGGASSSNRFAVLG